MVKGAIALIALHWNKCSIAILNSAIKSVAVSLICNTHFPEVLLPLMLSLGLIKPEQFFPVLTLRTEVFAPFRE